MGAVAAAVIVHKEREIVEAFRRAGATSAAKPSTLASLSLHEGVASHRLKLRAVLRETAPGTYYLDEPSWVALQGIRRRIALLMAVIGVVALLGVWMATRK